MASSAPTVQFLGTGAYLLFSFGVAKYLRTYYDTSTATALASSGGALAAVAFLSLPLSRFDEVAAEVATLFASLNQSKMPLFEVERVYSQVLRTVVTADALPLIAGRLQIATTLLPFFARRVRMDSFTSVDALLAALEASAYIPTYFQHLPRAPYQFEIDGGASSSTTSPRDSLIVCPKQKKGYDVTLERRYSYRLRIPTREEMLALYESGYTRAVFLQTNIERKLATVVNPCVRRT